MPVLPWQSLQQFSAHVIASLGTSSDVSQLVATHLVEANLAGHDSHGVYRLVQYCQHAKEGEFDPAATPTIVRETPTTATVDGRLCWGPVAARLAIETAVAKARKTAIAAVTMRRAYHVGRVGVYPAWATEHGLVGLAFCNVQGAHRVAPWGATESRMGTNPIAIAVPHDEYPIVVDFATTAVAEGKVRLAKASRQKVPLGWVLDEHGEFTTSPETAYTGGTIAPLGGDQGHKGYCLSVAMDLLGGVMSGAGCADLADHYGNGLLLICLDPGAFGDPEEFSRGVLEYSRYLKSAKTREEVEQILLPGEKEHRTTQQRRKDGVPLSAEVYEELNQIAKAQGVQPLSV